jgi:hypothetical protein
MGSRLSRLIGRSRSRSHSSLLALGPCRLRRTAWPSNCCCEPNTMSSCQRRGGTGDGVQWITVEPHPHMPASSLPADLPGRRMDGKQSSLGRALVQACCGTNFAEHVGTVTESCKPSRSVQSLWWNCCGHLCKSAAPPLGVDAMPTSYVHLCERLHHRHPIVSHAATCTDAHPAAQSTPASPPSSSTFIWPPLVPPATCCHAAVPVGAVPTPDLQRVQARRWCCVRGKWAITLRCWYTPEATCTCAGKVGLYCPSFKASPYPRLSPPPPPHAHTISFSPLSRGCGPDPASATPHP